MWHSGSIPPVFLDKAVRACIGDDPRLAGGFSHFFCLPALVVFAAILGRASVSAQNPDRPATVRGEWPTYGGDLASSKYSPLD